MKRISLMIITYFLIISSVYTQQEISLTERGNPNIGKIQNEITKLERISYHLNEMHKVLTENSQRVFQLNKEASGNLTNNIYKLYFKGSLEIYNKVTAPLNSALDLMNDVILNLTLEPYLWTIQNKQPIIKSLNNSHYYRNTKLRNMYITLGSLMGYDIKRFDDDVKPFTYTAQWWGTPDNENDDDIEKVTRKLNVIIMLSDLVYNKTEEELAKIRDERREVLSLIELLKNHLQKETALEEERIRKEKETEEWIARMRARVGINSENDIAESRQSFEYDPPEVKQKLSEIKNEQRILREQDTSNYEAVEQMKAAQKEKEANARVYIDAECSRYVLNRERVSFIIRAYPEDVKGTFILTVDDKEVAKSNKETNATELAFVFDQPGKYDIQAKLFINGKYNDTYTDQWYVEENPSIPRPPGAAGATSNPDKPPYPPGKEGKKELKLDLPFCKYYVHYTGGKVFLTGYYFTPAGQKVDYTSEPIEPSTAEYAHLSLLLTKSGTGYHYYQTIGGGKDGQNFILTRMRGANIDVINRFKAVSSQIKPASDLSTITIEYKEVKNGPLKTIILD